MIDKDQFKLSERVRSYIENEIQNSGFPEGKLPTESVLSSQLKVSRGTLRVALGELEKSGLIVRYRNRGTYLSDHKTVSGSFNKNIALIFLKGANQNDYSESLGFYSYIYFSILNESSKHEYSLITMSLNELDEKAILEKCKNIKIDGFIFMAGHKAEFVREFKKFKKNILIIDHKIDGLDINSLNINSYQGSFLAVQYLYELGHRNIAFLNRAEWQILNVERANGFFDGLKYCGLPNEESFHKLCEPSVDGGMKATQELFRLSNKPTAILCFDYAMATGVVKACVKQGVRIPDDISLIGFRGYPTSSSSSIFNTIDSTKPNLGKFVFDEFFADGAKNNQRCKNVMIDLKVVDNGSCKRLS